MQPVTINIPSVFAEGRLRRAKTVGTIIARTASKWTISVDEETRVSMIEEAQQYAEASEERPPIVKSAKAALKVLVYAGLKAKR